jgi:TonB family protein
MHPCSIVNPKQSRKFTMKNRVALCVVIAVSFALSGYAASETSKAKPQKTPVEKLNRTNGSKQTSGPTRTPKPEGRQNKPDTKGKKSSVEVVQGGDLTAKAISMPRVAMPADAKAAGASGPVKVQVQVDESGRVISANAISGHPALRQPAINAVRRAKFQPTKLSGQPVKVTGVIQYNFVLQ